MKRLKQECPITEVGGFLKRMCLGYGSTQLFQCLHSEKRYLRFMDEWDSSAGRWTLSYVSAICEEDEKAYQACGFNTYITADDLSLCGGYFDGSGQPGTRGIYEPITDSKNPASPDIPA